MMFDPRTLLMLALGVLLLMNGMSGRSFGFGRDTEEARAAEPDAFSPVIPVSDLVAVENDGNGDETAEAALLEVPAEEEAAV